MDKIKLGQRYISLAEPELGLGIVQKIESKLMVVYFPAVEEERNYRPQSAPIKRIIFNIGDTVEDNEGLKFEVTKIEENKFGLINYIGKENSLFETQLQHKVNLNGPVERIFNGLVDKQSMFNFRYETFKYTHWLNSLDVKGFIGPRLSLIPHQLYLSEKVTQMLHPRVLLADEVGLGKTIEAGLILHHLLITNRVSRILVITPEALNIQWFIEMLRKYNLIFSVVNEDSEDISNPFDENNLVITNFQLLKNNESLFKKAYAAEWDMLILDEAHRIEIKKEDSTFEYNFVKDLSQKVEALLLLTATPDVQGDFNLFSHLNLIDSEKFNDFEEFQQEKKQYLNYATKARKMISEGQDRASKQVKELIDSHGTGRVLYRNTRKNIDQDHNLFPERHLKSYALENTNYIKFENKILSDKIYQSKINWLVDFLAKNQKNKLLLICHSKNTVLQLEKDIREMTVGNKTGVFHEDLSLMAKDRQAAYFSETDGPNIMLCSEIGSEGRNFQFCQHLILFDLPMIPDLLEQRIGRLDRVGQKNKIYLHIPYLINSWEERLYEWYHMVMNGFTQTMVGASTLMNQYQVELNRFLNEQSNEKEFNQLKEKAKSDYLNIKNEIDEGRDILIELNSFDASTAREIIKKIRDIDDDYQLQTYLEQAYTQFGVDVDDLNEHSQYVKPGDNMFIPHFPYLSNEGFSYTYDRSTAVEREELDFMTWDHPMVLGILDLVEGEEFGNACVVTRKNGKVNNCLEIFWLSKAIAPKKLEVGRFFPPQLIRVLLDSKGTDLSDKWEKEQLDDKLEDGGPKIINSIVQNIPKDKVKNIIQLSKLIAEKKHAQLVEKKLKLTKSFFQNEIQRLKDLKKLHGHIQESEILKLEERENQVITSIQSSKINLDSIRFIY